MARLASITALFSFLSLVTCPQVEGQAVETQAKCESDQDCRRTHGADWFCRGVEGRCELWLEKRCLPFATGGCTDSRDRDRGPCMVFRYGTCQRNERASGGSTIEGEVGQMDGETAKELLKSLLK